MPTATTKLPPPTGEASTFKLGQLVTDRITGLKGTVTSIAQFAYAPPRIGVCAHKQKDKIDDAWFDEARLIPGKIQVEAKTLTPTIPMCEKAKDPISGFEGVVTGYFFYINGCIHVLLQPPEMKDGKPVEAQAFDEARLVYKGKPVESQADKGGPSGSRPRYSKPM
jgi:hypothetical protein